MKITREFVLPVLVFSGTLSAACGLRWVWLLHQAPEAAPKRLIPSGLATSRDDLRPGNAAADAPAFKLSDLRSVRSGLVTLPLDATPASLAAAFAGAWKKLADDAGPEMKLKAQQLFNDWLKVDREAAIRFVSEPPGILMRQGGEYLLAALAESDPERACSIAFKSGLDGPLASQSVLKVWGSRDPQAAMAFAASLPSHQRLAAETGAFAGWAAVAGPEAFAWLQTQPESWRRDRLMNGMAVTLLQNSPGEMADLVKQGSMPAEMKQGLRAWEARTDMTQLMNTVQDALASGAGNAALLDLAKGIQCPRLGAAVMAAVVQAAAPKNADDVAKLAAGLGISDPALFLSGLGRSAPEAGFAWALENKQPLTGLASTWAEYDAKSAMQNLLALPRGDVADAAARAILDKAVQTAPEEAIECAVQVPMPANQRRNQLSAAARILARSDPAEAVASLARIPDAPPEEVSAVLAISGRADAKAAAAALAECDLNTNGYIASESLTRGWAVADPSGASEWARTLPKGELRDGGAAGLARSVMQSDPPAAFTWAMEIGDDTIRYKVAHQAVQELKNSHTLEQLQADENLSDATRGMLRDYWNLTAPPAKAGASGVGGTPFIPGAPLR